MVQMVGLEPTVFPILNRMRLPIAPHLYRVPIEAWFDGEKEEGGCGYVAFAALAQTAEAEWSSLLLTWYALGESDPRPTD